MKNIIYFSTLENSELLTKRNPYFNLQASVDANLEENDKKLSDQEALKYNILNYSSDFDLSSNSFHKLKYYLLCDKGELEAVDKSSLSNFIVYKSVLMSSSISSKPFNLNLFSRYFLDRVKESASFSSFSIHKYSYLSLVLRVTLNNIFLTLINNSGEVLLSLSGGRVGMKGFNRRSQTSLKLMLRKLIMFLKKNRLENKLLFFFVKTN